MPDSHATIIAALIGVAGPVVTVLATRWLDSLKWLRVTGRPASIVGEWEGTFEQKVQDSSVAGKLDVIFSAGRRRITGKGKYEILGETPKELKIDPRVKIEFDGGFLSDQLVRLNFENPGTLQCGTIVAKLDAAGRRMEGFYAGFGLNTNNIVQGYLRLEKC